MLRPKDGKISDEVWDDTQYIRREISHPDMSENQYLFCKKPIELKNNIYVPRYYWKH